MASGLDGRHRDDDGTIERKRGDTQIGTLREIYGPAFATEHRADMRLDKLLRVTGHMSLSDYLSHQRRAG